MFVELNVRRDAGYTVSLEWDRDSGTTQIVVVEPGNARLLAFPVPGPKAADAFRHPFKYAP